eukprot:CAMPEP_0201511364 /NCGR_PEP_ID=MMETSP0161_2-20130828/3841_1 /ASSEMBLY_ACC=CAM_ASM_000251 /TAXON_ID=180227 /ORGANISM="Neoparamoeba aestuarina, Strain SoJaBio B1-5/56/2" /LENGTH=103 /DNA_ID=CAMNT_0047906835 /DNA_START=368 /DNA_END=679 /DNA_ORIENTATION=-
MLMYCIPDVEEVQDTPATILEMLDLIMYLINFVILCISMVWAMKLTIAFGEAGDAPTAGYGHLDSGGRDNFSAFGQNHEFNAADNCLLDDSDDGEVLVSDPEA